MKTAYFDCFSGISGDMCLGALVDAGVSLDRLRDGLKGLPLEGCGITKGRVMRAGMAATKVTVRASGAPRRRWEDVSGIIGESLLSPWVKEKGLEVFRGLFEAEGRVHGETCERTHLHELGAVDALVDIIGTLICLEALGVERVLSSPVNLGFGMVRTEHGLLPVPAPATVELLRGIPVYSTGGVEGELATPTGAALLKALAMGFGPMPVMRVEAVGAGAGDMDSKERPNVLRVFIGWGHAESEGEVTVIETNMDDMNPQVYGHLMEVLLRKGALDAYLTQVIMKKGRPGVKLTVLSTEDKADGLMETIFRETTTIGLRYWRSRRAVLPRAVRTVETGFGSIRLKEARLGERVLRAVPEYEDCRRAAIKHNVPIEEVMRAARKQSDES